MHLDKFDLNLLVALDALLREKHVTRAADTLHVSQPAMSGALNRLRQYFGDQLLEKVGGSFQLTPKATEIAGEVRDLLFRIRATLRNELHFEPETASRDFRIIVSDYVSSVFMPFMMQRLLECAPNLRCEVQNMSSDSLTRVDIGVADFCVTPRERELLENREIAEDLEQQHLFNDKFVLVSAASRNSRSAAIGVEELCALPYIEVRFAHATFSLVESEILRANIPINRVAVVPSFTAAAFMIPETDLTAIMPFRLAKILSPVLALAIQEVPIEMPIIQETLLWHKRSDADPALLWFRRFVQRSASEFSEKAQEQL